MGGGESIKTNLEMNKMKELVDKDFGNVNACIHAHYEKRN